MTVMQRFRRAFLSMILLSWSLPVFASGTLTGTVFNAATNATISGASVSFGTSSATSNGSGVYTLTNIACSNSTVIAGKTGYVNAVFSYTPTTCPGTSTQNIFMTPVAITSISPNSGPAAGGTIVTINGTGLTNATSVTFGGTAGTNIGYDTGTGALHVTTPAHVAGSVNVVFTGGYGTVTSVNGFTYNSSTGTLTGTVFDAATNATISGASVSFGLSSATTNSSGAYTLTNIACANSTLIVGKTGYTNASINYTPSNCPGTSTQNVYMTPIAITGISPSSGPATGGTVVTITGVGFTFVPSVTFGGTAGTNIGYVTNGVQVTTPAHAAGSVNVVVTTGYGTITSVNGFTYNSSTGTLTGTVFDAATNATISGASVSFGLSSATTNSSGVYTLTNIACGASTLIVGKTGYLNASTNYTPTNCPGTSTQNVFMTPISITGISPSSGPATGGTVVAINGLGLTNATSVTFGGTAGTNIGYVSGVLQVTTPAHAAGSVNVVFTGGYGTVTSVNGFTYNSSTGTLTGTVFDAATNATISGASVSFGLASATTNSSGVYTLTNIACGASTLIVGKTGYLNASINYTPSNCPGTSTQNVFMTPNTTPAPVVNTFTATPSSIKPSGSSTLSWTTTNATSVSIDFGVGSQPVNGSVSVTPAVTTTYTLTATGTGGTKTATALVTVERAAPTANFTVSPPSPTAGEPATFTDTSTGAPTSWSWNFGDGSAVSTIPSPTHIYTQAGSYSVTLTATNQGGPNVATRTVTVVAAAPVLNANFGFLPLVPAVGQQVTFMDFSTGSPTSWSWDFQDGATSPLRNPMHIFTATASYRVRLTVGRGTDISTVSIVVPVGSLTAPPAPERLIFREVSALWPKPASKAVVITHGWHASATDWVMEMAAKLCGNLGASLIVSSVEDLTLTQVCQARDWDVWVVDWRSKANMFYPWDASANAKDIGDSLTSILAKKPYSHIHLIAHSAGANLIDSATTGLRYLSGLEIHDTFLDAYDPALTGSRYGEKADWSDNYVDTRNVAPFFSDLDGTKLTLQYGYNVDVTTSLADETKQCDYACRHSRPYRFYGMSIASSFVGDAPSAAYDKILSTGGMGYPLSLESGQLLSTLNSRYPKGAKCTMLGAICSEASLPSVASSFSPVAVTGTAIDSSSGAVSYVEGSGTTFFDSIRLGGITSLPNATPTAYADSNEPTDSPSWISVFGTASQPVNTLLFNWRFTATGEGVLQVLVDGTLVREIDQRYVPLASLTAERIYIGGGTGTLLPGIHRIAFRLDGFGTGASGVELTGVQFGVASSTSQPRHRAAKP
jgi:PKD repeat protein